MRHVDDGMLHAWLDGEVTDRTTAAWLDEHLQQCAECASRLAEARSEIDRADALLSSAMAAGDTPHFDRIVERAGPSTAVSPRRAERMLAKPTGWVIPASWAASLALAAALGWSARDRAIDTRTEDIVAVIPTSTVERAAPDNGAAPAAAPEGQRSLAATAAPAELPADPAGASTQERSEARGTLAAEPAARARQAPSSGASKPQQTPADAAGAEAPELARPATAAAAAAAPPAAVPPAAMREERVQTDLQSVQRGESPFATVPSLTPASGRAGRTPGTTATAQPGSTRTAAGVSPLPAAPVAGGRIALDPASYPEWRPMSRTEAAVLTRMPLYGIEGLAAALTSVDVRSNTVRTVYNLPSGASIELVQEPATAETPNLLFAQPAQALAEAGARRADSGAGPVREWSGVRGNARLTLRQLSGAGDVMELSTRLRLD